MSIAEVRNLPLREKFQILEVIWDDLSARVDEMHVSPAVRDLLDDRMDRIQNGSVDVHDWDSVKYSIESAHIPEQPGAEIPHADKSGGVIREYKRVSKWQRKAQ